jgi:AcrR family transcriptional regulator
MASRDIPSEPRVREPQAKGETTRLALVAAARRLFGDQGFAATPVDEIVREAGVTKGALYHHFRDKDDLFRAVVEDVKRDVTNVVGAAFLAAAADSDPLGTITEGCLAFIEAHRDRAVQRITILDARAVLDAATRRDLDARYEVAVVRGALRRAMRLGVIDDQPLRPLAHVVAGALAEGCALIADSDDEATAQREVGQVITRLLEGLRPRA